MDFLGFSLSTTLARLIFQHVISWSRAEWMTDGKSTRLCRGEKATDLAFAILQGYEQFSLAERLK